MYVRSLPIIAAIAAIIAVTALPSFGANPKPSAAMMKPIEAVAMALNTGNVSSLSTGVYTSNATVVDEFSPYMWSGSNAGINWLTDFEAFAKKIHLTNGKAALMPVKNFEQSGNRAYVVVPTNFGAMINGKPVKETGAWTFTLQRAGSSWLIQTETWGRLTQTM